MEYNSTAPTRALWVSNITPHVTEGLLRALFGAHGAVESVRVVPAKGVAFVSFPSEPAATMARAVLNNTLFAGGCLKINYARPVPEGSAHIESKTNDNIV